MKAKDIADILFNFFIQNNSLSLPGIGTFDMFRISAQTDFANKKMLPPTFTISYNNHFDSPQQELFHYVSKKKNIAEWEAIKMVNDFAFDLKNSLKTGESIDWDGLGLLKQGYGKEIIFEPHRLSYEFIPHVSAHRVIRESSNHAMLVGDRERSKSEMLTFLSHDAPEVKVKGGWWSIAAIIAALAVMLMAIRAFSGGLSIMDGRQQIIKPGTENPTYTIQNPIP